MRMAAIVCPSCAVTVPLDDVDLATKLAKCRRCVSVFDFRDQVRTPQAEARRRRELVPPAGFRRVEAPDRVERAGYRDAGDASKPPLVIHQRWRGWRSVRTVLAGAVGMLWSFGAASALFRDGALTMGHIVGVALFASPALALIGATIVLLVNRTTFRIDDEHVVVRHGPFPWLGNLTTPSKTIRTLHVATRKASLGGAPYVFDILADTPATPTHVVARSFRTIEGARFVAWAIAERLSLPDPD